MMSLVSSVSHTHFISYGAIVSVVKSSLSMAFPHTTQALVTLNICRASSCLSSFFSPHYTTTKRQNTHNKITILLRHSLALSPTITSLLMPTFPTGFDSTKTYGVSFPVKRFNMRHSTRGGREVIEKPMHTRLHQISRRAQGDQHPFALRVQIQGLSWRFWKN
jgi:hypothetical protein